MSTFAQAPAGTASHTASPAEVSAAREKLRAASVHLRLGEFARAQTMLDEAAAALPDAAEVERLRGLLHYLRGELGDALAVLTAANRRWPDDAAILGVLAGALRDIGDSERAVAAFRKVCEIDPDAAAGWYNLGVAEVGRERFEEADAAFSRALECAPDHVLARLGHADMFVRRGEDAAAAAAFRSVLAAQPSNLRAWTGLAISTGEALTSADIATLRTLPDRPGLDDEQRAVAAFALARALEARGDFDAALVAFDDANARRRQRLAWDAGEFSGLVDRITDAFARPAGGAPDPGFGGDCVLLVGLPGAASAAAIAGLAAHADAAVGDGTPELINTIQEESNARGAPFPDWIAAATAADWQRLGRRYLARSARWRGNATVQVDSALGNWPFLGAALAMLPGLRVIDCRDDPLETTWALYRGLFVGRREGYSYALNDVAAHWRDYERLMLFWHARYPQQIRPFDAAPAGDDRGAWRDLLAACGLADDEECAGAASRARRARPATTAAVYGARINHLRRLLDLPAVPA